MSGFKEELLKSAFKTSSDGILYRLDKTGWKEAPTSMSTGGYLRVSIPGRKSLEKHRLIWLLLHGNFPKNEIDHIDGCRTNNHPSNLREVTREQNQANRLPNKNSQSRYKGVYRGYGTKWISSISKSGVRYYLGQFSCETAAAIAYNKKATELNDVYRRLNT